MSNINERCPNQPMGTITRQLSYSGSESDSEKCPMPRKKRKQITQWSAAFMTPLVRSVFNLVFAEQMKEEVECEKAEKEGSKKRSKRCGLCDHCMRQDCGEFKNCKNMTKFRGNGKSKQACEGRKCEEIKNGEDQEEEEDDMEQEVPLTSDSKAKEKKGAKKVHKEVEWLGEGVVEGRRTYYPNATQGTIPRKTSTQSMHILTAR